MANCRICNEIAVSDGLCGNPICKRIIIETRERILKQNNEMNKLNPKNKVCKKKNCETIVIYPKQLCESCKQKNLSERKKLYVSNRKTKRYCRNTSCGKELINPESPATRYCSDECRPRDTVATNKRRDNPKPKKVLIKKVHKPIDKKWLERGTISSNSMNGGFE